MKRNSFSMEDILKPKRECLERFELLSEMEKGKSGTLGFEGEDTSRLLAPYLPANEIHVDLLKESDSHVKEEIQNRSKAPAGNNTKCPSLKTLLERPSSPFIYTNTYSSLLEFVKLPEINSKVSCHNSCPDPSCRRSEANHTVDNTSQRPQIHSDALSFLKLFPNSPGTKKSPESKSSLSFCGADIYPKLRTFQELPVFLSLFREPSRTASPESSTVLCPEHYKAISPKSKCRISSNFICKDYFTETSNSLIDNLRIDLAKSSLFKLIPNLSLDYSTEKINSSGSNYQNQKMISKYRMDGNRNIWTSTYTAFLDNLPDELSVSRDDTDSGLKQSSNLREVAILPFPPRRRIKVDSFELELNRKCRRSRTVFTERQQKELESRFGSQKYLSTSDRVDLADELGLSQLQVKTWYQNRRMKWKKQVMESGNETPTKPKGRPKKNSVPSLAELTSLHQKRPES